MVSSLTGTLGCQLVVLPQERGPSLSCLRLCSSNIVDLLVMTGSPPGGSCSPWSMLSQRWPWADTGTTPVESRRSTLDPAQHQVLDSIEAHSPESNGVSYGVVDFFRLEVLHQSEHLHELPLSSLAHPRLQQPRNISELLGQLPSNQRRRQASKARLLLKERQVMERVEDEVVSIVGPPMAGDDFNGHS